MAGRHTIRRSPCSRYYSSKAHFSDVKRERVTHEDGSKEVAVSAVDFLLSDTDSFVNSVKNYSSRVQGGNLNKNNMWETVIEELESSCISKIERPQQHTGKMEIVYKVPIVGHKLYAAPNGEEDDYILGAYHDVDHHRQIRGSNVDQLSKSVRRNIKRNPSQVT